MPDKDGESFGGPRCGPYMHASESIYVYDIAEISGDPILCSEKGIRTLCIEYLQLGNGKGDKDIMHRISAIEYIDRQKMSLSPFRPEEDDSKMQIRRGRVLVVRGADPT